MPMFKKDQLVKCIKGGSGHKQGQTYTVIDPNRYDDNDDNKELLIMTNIGLAYQWRFVPFTEKKPEEWL